MCLTLYAVNTLKYSRNTIFWKIREFFHLDILFNRDSYSMLRCVKNDHFLLKNGTKVELIQFVVDLCTDNAISTIFITEIFTLGDSNHMFSR